MSFPSQQVVCQLFRDGPPKCGDKILLKFMDCAYQNNSDDCGLYAIANAVAEAFGIDPTTQEYDTELMRGHLIHCLEQNELSLFPAKSQESYFAGGVRYLAYVPQSILHLSNARRRPLCHLRQVQYKVSPQ